MAVSAAAWFLPEPEVSVADLPVPDGTERHTVGRLGIDTIRADDRMDAVQLGECAARRVLERAGADAGELGALIVVESRAPDTFLSSEATRLQRLLGADAALTFTVGGLGCVSITPALFAARGLLAADPDLGDVLVVHGSKPVSSVRYRHPVTVSGDGGQALLLSRGGPVRILDIAQRSNGQHWNLFHVKYRDRPTAQWREECEDPSVYSFRLAIETRNALSGLLAEVLERNGLGKGDIRGHLSHNLSAGSLAFTEDALGIGLLPVCRENLRRYGHLGPNDVFLNLYTALERGELAPGDHVVLINASPVAAWSVVLVRIGPQEAVV
ncbi:ketoacyl-ACP synthase III family protein [Streptomyces sp. NPDC000594]|uniref:ketoacyl-ACP synthase III family protein n=1 Tax=Streptomyces sp. NPDC000594 TaxID=3154261 RepID=UPI003332D13E